MSDCGREALAQLIDQHALTAASGLPDERVARIRIMAVVTNNGSLSARLAITRFNALWTLRAILPNNRNLYRLNRSGRSAISASIAFGLVACCLRVFID
jgi:hypothetical protein